MVCNYGEAGNLLTAPVYQTGPACSACREGSECSVQYPGLCTTTGQGDSLHPGDSVQPVQPPAVDGVDQLEAPVQPVLPAGRPVAMVTPGESVGMIQAPMQPAAQPAGRPVLLISPSTQTCRGSTSFFCLLTQPGRAVETVMSSAHHMTHMVMDSVAALPAMVGHTVPDLGKGSFNSILQLNGLVHLVGRRRP